jgi:amidase
MDENGFGLGQNFVQAKTVRDAAAMLDCLAVARPGDPFLIPGPPKPYAALAQEKAPRLKIGWSTDGLMGLETDPEVAQAVAATAALLAEMGHAVVQESPETIGVEAMSSMANVWFFGFDLRLEGYSKRSGRRIGPDTLEPTTLTIYEHAKRMTAAQFLEASVVLNSVRRKLGRYFTRYDIWLSPTTTRAAEPWGNYGLGKSGLTLDEISEKVLRPTCQFTLPHNIMGTPAISLPIAVNSAGMPIGVQLGARPAQEHRVLQLAAELEHAKPWTQRLPPLHVSRFGRA